MSSEQKGSDTSAQKRFFAAFVVAFLLLAVGVSYLDEDAFISFRVVDNAVHGFGLRWNVDERVQVYTNPAWVLALIPLHAVFDNVGWASFILSAAASTAAVAWVAWRLKGEPLFALVGFALPLLLSQSFTDYTSSGLENPFVYLAVALFAERALREEAGTPWLWLCLATSLGALTRLDSFLLFAPLLIWRWLRDPRGAAYGRIALGAAPLLAWLGFALLYYGTAFPNPKYAKLNGGIPLLRYVELGGNYLLDALRNDVVTGLVLVFGPVAALAGRRLGLSTAGRLLLAGSSLYSLYVVYVGGDFMAGRYWSGPTFLTVVTLALEGVRAPPPPPRLAHALALLLAARFVVQPITEQKLVVETRDNGRFAIVRDGGIRLQRFNCGTYEALIGSKGPPSEHDWSQTGLRYRAEVEAARLADPGAAYVVVDGNAGKTGFFAGPGVTIVDHLGLADALLARLPDADGKMVMAGHLKREVPEGYLEARRTGDTSGMDPELLAYYQPLRSIISDPLLSTPRLQALWGMGTGAYDAHLRAYVAKERR